MAGKKKKGAQGIRVSKDSVHVKFVPKAGKWCKTVIKNGQQTQIWSDQQPGEK